MLNLAKTYNLIPKYPSILGSKLINLKLVSILTFEQATKVLDVITQHQNILKVASTTDVINSLSYKDFQYHHFKNDDNIDYVLPLEYLASYTESGNSFIFKVNNISNIDKNIIKTVLTQQGYTLEEIS